MTGRIEARPSLGTKSYCELNSETIRNIKSMKFKFEIKMKNG